MPSDLRRAVQTASSCLPAVQCHPGHPLRELQKQEAPRHVPRAFWSPSPPLTLLPGGSELSSSAGPDAVLPGGRVATRLVLHWSRHPPGWQDLVRPTHHAIPLATHVDAGGRTIVPATISTHPANSRPVRSMRAVRLSQPTSSRDKNVAAAGLRLSADDVAKLSRILACRSSRELEHRGRLADSI
jgi:hypothetical protein